MLDTEIDSLGVGELKDVKGQSVQFSLQVMFDSLQPHGLQYARLLCFAPSPRVWASLVTQMVKNPPVMQETCV